MTFVSRDIPHLKKIMTVVRLSLEIHDTHFIILVGAGGPHGQTECKKRKLAGQNQSIVYNIFVKYCNIFVTYSYVILL